MKKYEILMEINRKQIFSELEIIRLLDLFAPDNDKVEEMVNNTLKRLRDTCFGNLCIQGECVVTGISV